MQIITYFLGVDQVMNLQIGDFIVAHGSRIDINSDFKDATPLFLIREMKTDFIAMGF